MSTKLLVAKKSYLVNSPVNFSLLFDLAGDWVLHAIILTMGLGR